MRVDWEEIGGVHSPVSLLWEYPPPPRASITRSGKEVAGQGGGWGAEMTWNGKVSCKLESPNPSYTEPERVRPLRVEEG